MLQRAVGQYTALPAEPVLSPDRQRVVVADFCERAIVMHPAAYVGQAMIDQFGKIGRSAEHEESPVLAGMLRKVRHLVKIENA